MFGWGKKLTKEEDREKQIKELKHSFPSIRRPNNDDNLFELKFVVDTQYSALRVIIPNDFPTTRPVLQVQGPVTHPWLDQFKQVNGSHKLMNWTQGKSSLAEVVEESLQALMHGKNSTQPPQALDSYGRPIQSSAQAPQPQQAALQAAQPQPQAMPTSTPTPQANVVQQNHAMSSGYPNATPVYPNPFGPASAITAAGPYGAAAVPGPTMASAYPVNTQPNHNMNNNPYGSYPVIPNIAPGAQHSPSAAGQPAVSAYGYSGAPAMSYGQPAVQPSMYASPVSVFPGNVPAAVGGYGMRSNNSDPNLSYLNNKPPALESVENSNKSNFGNNSGKTSAAVSAAVSAGNSLKGPPAFDPIFDDDARSPIPIPDIPLQFPELEKLTDIQLTRLLNDEVALEAQANTVDSVGTTKSLRDQLSQANHDRASKNVLMSEEIMLLQREAIEVQNKLKAARKEYQDIQDRVSKKHGFNGAEVVSELTKKKAVLDTESEEVGRKLVSGDLELSAFPAEFLEKRIKYHTLQDRIQLATKPQYQAMPTR